MKFAEISRDIKRIWARRYASYRLHESKWLTPIKIRSILLFFLAGVAVLIAVEKIHNTFFSKNITTAQTKSPLVRRIYLVQADYQGYVATLSRLNPGVQIGVLKSEDAIDIAISDEELFPDFMMALHTLQSFKPGMAWELVELCVRKCPENTVSRAVVRGFKQEIK